MLHNLQICGNVNTLFFLRLGVFSPHVLQVGGQLIASSLRLHF